MITKKSALTFFQQSAWVGAATALGGLCNAGVQSFSSRKLGHDEWGTFFAILQSWMVLAIPSLGLQAVFMHYAVSAEVSGRRAALAGAVRGMLKVNAALWMLFAVFCFVFRREAEDFFQASGPGFLIVTALVLPASALLGIFNGVAQGTENFALFGWVGLLGGFTRLVFVGLAVSLLGATALSAAIGVLLGFVATLVVAAWGTRSVWMGETAEFHWRPFVRKAIFLTVGLGAGSWLMALDVVMAKKSFSPAEAGLYGTAGLVGKVLIPLSASLIAVMFPKVARSKALAQRSGDFLLTLGLTALAALGCTVFLTLFPEWTIRLLQGQAFVGAAQWVPLYCLCQIPLTLGNVTLVNLMGRERYSVAPVAGLLAIAYYFALARFHSSPREVIQVMGLAGLCLLGVTAFFTWGWSDGKPSLPAGRPGFSGPAR